MIYSKRRWHYHGMGVRIQNQNSVPKDSTGWNRRSHDRCTPICQPTLKPHSEGTHKPPNIILTASRHSWMSHTQQERWVDLFGLPLFFTMLRTRFLLYSCKGGIHFSSISKERRVPCRLHRRAPREDSERRETEVVSIRGSSFVWLLMCLHRNEQTDIQLKSSALQCTNVTMNYAQANWQRAMQLVSSTNVAEGRAGA